MELRRATAADGPRLWALNALPNVGRTADPSVPLDLPLPVGPPPAFPDLADVEASFVGNGGDFLVAVEGAFVVGMGGFKPRSAVSVEVLRVRVHPARRRAGIGRRLMTELERRAAGLGFEEATLETATNQPDAVAFYRSLGYVVLRHETRPEWSWTLVHLAKPLRA